MKNSSLSMVTNKKTNNFPWEAFPYRLDFTYKSRVACFECQEHMDKEIERYNLKPKDYKASCKRGYKIIRQSKPKKRKKEIIKPKVETKRKELLSPTMKFKTIQFDKQPKLLHPKMK